MWVSPVMCDSIRANLDLLDKNIFFCYKLPKIKLDMSMYVGNITVLVTYVIIKADAMFSHIITKRDHVQKEMKRTLDTALWYTIVYDVGELNSTQICPLFFSG